MTLKDVCAEIEAATPDVGASEAVEWAQAESQLLALRERSDTEAQNAIDLMLPEVQKMAADPEPGMDYMDAEAGIDGAITAVRERCATVGATAFQ
jgi:hypothetical protein